MSSHTGLTFHTCRASMSLLVARCLCCVMPRRAANTTYTGPVPTVVHVVSWGLCRWQGAPRLLLPLLPLLLSCARLVDACMPLGRFFMPHQGIQCSVLYASATTAVSSLSHGVHTAQPTWSDMFVPVATAVVSSQPRSTAWRMCVTTQMATQRLGTCLRPTTFHTTTRRYARRPDNATNA